MMRNFALYYIFTFCLLSCKANKIPVDKFCNTPKWEFESQIIIEFSNKLSFDKEKFTVIEQGFIEDFVKCVNGYHYKNLEIVVYFNGGSIFEMEKCAFRGLNMEKLLASFGIDKTQIKSSIKHDKESLFKMASPYKRVEVIIHK